MAELGVSVRFIKGIGEKRAKLLGRLGVESLRDLIRAFPRAYEDRTLLRPIAEIGPEETVCVLAMVAGTPTLSRVRSGLELLKFRIVDETGAIDVTFFNQSYLREQIKAGASYVFYGRTGLLGKRIIMTNPVFEPETARVLTGRIVPVYRLTAGISQKTFMSAVRQGLDACAGVFPDALPPALRQEHELADAAFTYENIHFPADMGALELARKRLIFEELFVLSCALGLLRAHRKQSPGVVIEPCDLDAFYAALPFQPTGAQRRAIENALADMGSGLPMNRLVQGDVGSGKTLVAAAAIYAVCKSGRQCAFMAPTEILAEQHFVTCQTLLAPFGLRIAKLTGSMSARQKQRIHAELEGGLIDLVVGTHAIISQGVRFQSLALVITDEQHRFGVSQRSALSEKSGEQLPHVLVMSATPIPRTLALIIYGDLDVSVIDELPPGRQEIDTYAVGEAMRPRINNFMRRLVDEGRQVYMVCPMVEESEELPDDVKSATEHAKLLAETVFPDLRVDCIHGKMKPRDKDKAMRRFVDGQTDILVSTTVIEVGVDVPNAALMVVENAERFGLSQLHQLRGRVGRGRHKSCCVLFSDAKGEEAKARLGIMCKTGDGFKIAEEDLKNRGPGDFFGSRQHGLPEMHIADLGADMDVLQSAQNAAKAVLAADPALGRAENAALKDWIDLLFDIHGDTLN